jgi:hypothetical protein
MTHGELVIMPREFHPHEIHFFSLIKNVVTHQKRLYDSLLNTNETLMKPPLKLT